MNYIDVFDEIFSQFKGPKFSIKLWDGKEYFYGKGRSKSFSLVISDEKTAKKLLAQGALGFGESYMDGSLQIEGDIEAYLKLRHQFKYVKKSFNLLKATFLAVRSIPKETKDQIAYHYDLGNDFFSKLLDKETMSYSSGLFTNNKDSLQVAQQNKIKLVCDWLDLPKGSSVLDLGVGWGGFAEFAVKKYDWKITGLTLSKAQIKYCKNLIQDEQISNNFSVLYRDMLKELPNKKYDAIVVLESIEHVGQKKLKSFIGKLNNHLKPGGLIYIQTTGRYKIKQVDKWTLKYVFPGGYIPSKGEIINGAKKANLDVLKFEDNTKDYILTLTTWIKNLEKNQKFIESKYDKSFYRLWYLWMHGAKVSFEQDSMNLFRILLKKQ